jgi:hypothetical protein
MKPFKYAQTFFSHSEAIMKEYQRHLILLLGFMALLTGVFIFLIEYSPDSLDITPEKEETNNTADVNVTSNTSIPLLSDSVGGLQSLFSDSQEGLKYFSESGDSP